MSFPHWTTVVQVRVPVERGFGALTPFRLVWHDSAVAREHLVAGYDGCRHGPSITLEDLLDVLTAYHVEIELR